MSNHISEVKQNLLPNHTKSTKPSLFKRNRRFILLGILILFLAGLLTVFFFFTNSYSEIDHKIQIPIVVTTWDFFNATKVAFLTMNKSNALDGLEKGVNFCENYPEECHNSVGFGGNPNDIGEVTLDAMIMWGANHDTGAVGNIKGIKNAISVARKVMEYTEHSFLVGEDATDFAIKLGFPYQNLSTPLSEKQYKDWIDAKCFPNYWKNRSFLRCPSTSKEKIELDSVKQFMKRKYPEHDTIGMVVIDKNRNIACGTSTNGKRYKIHGRVGDSPLIGSGAYCDNKKGAATATGDGDIIMRFLPSFKAVDLLDSGLSPTMAAEAALRPIKEFYPNATAALIVVNKFGDYGAAVIGFQSFPFMVFLGGMDKPKMEIVYNK